MSGKAAGNIVEKKNVKQVKATTDARKNNVEAKAAEQNKNSNASNPEGPPTDLENKIIKQIEYYFGNFNLNRDKFLRSQIQENDGWVSLETMIKFNRLRYLSTEFNAITVALRKSENKLLEVSEDGLKIRRNPDKPLVTDPEWQQKMKKRCVYVKRFPYNSSLDELQEFFSTFGNIENVQMRRFPHSNRFRRSVFVTFATEEEADKFMELPTIKYKNGTELSKETREQYTKRKDDYYQELKKVKIPSINTDDGKKEENQKEGEENDNQNEGDSLIEGCLLKVTGLDEDGTWEILKSFFNPLAPVAYADFKKGKTEAVIRFTKEGDAQVALEAALNLNRESKLMINGKEVFGTVLEGEEELFHWKSMQQVKLQLRQRAMKKGKKRFGKRKGKFQRKGKDKESSDEPAAKKTKTEA